MKQEETNKPQNSENTSTEFDSNQIVAKYNEIKNKYSIFFQKAIELDDELREHK